MPSPRAVLSDIHNLSLDPKKAWSSLGKDGRLKKNVHPATDANVAESNVVDSKYELPQVHQELLVQEIVHESAQDQVDLNPVEAEDMPVEAEDMHAEAVDMPVEAAITDSLDQELENAESISLETTESADNNSEIDFRPKKKKK